MSSPSILGAVLAQRGISRRAFLKYCTVLASLMALPAGTAPAIAQALVKAKRPSVVWLPFQECTGCTESILRSAAPTTCWTLCRSLRGPFASSAPRSSRP